jgi:type III restriction enzyme
MSSFLQNPILNTPYSEPSKHWILDSTGQPTGQEGVGRRNPGYVVPVAAPRRGTSQPELDLEVAQDGTENTLVKLVRPEVDR